MLLNAGKIMLDQNGNKNQKQDGHNDLIFLSILTYMLKSCDILFF